MMNIVITYEMLGNQFKSLGAAKTTPNISIAKQQKLYFQQLVEAIKKHGKVKKYIENSNSRFSRGIIMHYHSAVFVGYLWVMFMSFWFLFLLVNLINFFNEMNFWLT